MEGLRIYTSTEIRGTKCSMHLQLFPTDPYKYLVITINEYHGACHLHKYN